MADKRDLYAELGVPRTASADDIRRAYRKLAKQFHPDVNPGKKDAEERFKSVNSAYEVLSSPERRRDYDEFGDDALRTGFDAAKARDFKRQWEQPRPGPAGFNPFSGWGAASQGGGGFAFDPEDLMDTLTGRRRNVQRRQPAHAVVDITLAQALRGTHINLTWRGPQACERCGGTGSADAAAPVRCTRCQGSGRVEAGGSRVNMATTCTQCGGVGWMRTACNACEGVGQVERPEEIVVRIPPGADQGSRLRVTSRGGQDITLETRIKPHPYFRREGLDLHVRLPVTLDEAFNGGKVKVPTVDGSVEMTVPARTQSGTRLRLRGKGVTRGSQKGDLFVEVDVRLPEGESPELAQAVRNAAAAYTRGVRDDVEL